MVFRDWNAYQDALGEYERLLTGFEKEEETWTKDLQEIQERKGVTPWGCLTFILATFVGLCAESWDVVLCIFLVYGFARVYGNRGRRIRRFERRNPRPVFNYSKPEFRPPEESEAQKPQQNELTLSAARELLELGGQCSDEELKQAYRQKIRQYHPDMVATLGKELREMAEAMTKGYSSVEASMITKDGRSIPMIFTGVKLDIAGRDHLLGIGIDITNVKRAQEALRESEERFRILTESSPTAILLYQNDKWVYANSAATHITGYTNQEFLGMNFWDVVHPDYKQLIQERGQRRQRAEALTNSYECKIISKDGAVKWVDLTGATIIFGGSPAGIISVLDIT